MSKSSEWKTLICPVCNHDVTTNAPEQLLTKINSALATIRQEERRAALRHLSDTIDNFRASGRNLTLWCTPRAVVVQITLHDEDASPDVDRSFSSFAAAVTFALEAKGEDENGKHSI